GFSPSASTRRAALAFIQYYRHRCQRANLARVINRPNAVPPTNQRLFHLRGSTVTDIGTNCRGYGVSDLLPKRASGSPLFEVAPPLGQDFRLGWRLRLWVAPLADRRQRIPRTALPFPVIGTARTQATQHQLNIYLSNVHYATFH